VSGATAGERRPVRRVVFEAEEIGRRVGELGEEIAERYTEADDLLVLGLLKGSFIFVADLVRAIPLPHQVDFMMVRSYGSGTETSGDVRLILDAHATLEGRAVVLVEDIVDSGTTLRALVPQLRERGPASLEICALLHKRLEGVDPEPLWVGFDAPNEFLVGYGLDHAEDFRHLPYIASL
jgi:hypoxanthine phosphoribosyltransferase